MLFVNRLPSPFPRPPPAPTRVFSLRRLELALELLQVGRRLDGRRHRRELGRTRRRERVARTPRAQAHRRRVHVASSTPAAPGDESRDAARRRRVAHPGSWRPFSRLDPFARRAEAPAASIFVLEELGESALEIRVGFADRPRGCHVCGDPRGSEPFPRGRSASGHARDRAIASCAREAPSRRRAKCPARRRAARSRAARSQATT